MLNLEKKQQTRINQEILYKEIIMTIQELIDELEYSIKELDFNPNATILIDIIENVDGLTEQTSEVLVDNDSVCKDLLSINAYIKEEMNNG
ncbi:MAG: hypothetical protein CMM02_03105 [Rhodopirellula sp.]|jgi:hypothetical protein|nr:hypothetical protein [Rhodopirellula sp.]